jgi:lipopolysaccharide transport system permease protein
MRIPLQAPEGNHLAVTDLVESIPPSDLPVTRIRPPRGWQPVNVGELWRFRELIYFLAWRDVKVRYKQTFLGVAWAILQPGMMMVVFTLFFHRLADVQVDGPAYPVFVLAGLLPWTFFSTAVASAGNSVVGSERLITKIYFPRLAIPFAGVGAAGVDFLIALGLLGVLMAWYGVTPSAQLWLAPAVFVLIALTATGIGTLLAALNVKYRDFRYVVPFLLQVGMFATPTIYMQPSAKSDVVNVLLTLNPLATLIAAFRAACLGGPVPWPGVGGAAVCAALLFLGGCFYFRRVEENFADII